MHNPATAFFTAEDKQRHPYLSSVLEPSTQKVIATAAVRVYHAPFINAHMNWTYSNLRGILVFGRDRDGDGPVPPGVPPPDRGIGIGAHGHGHGLRLKEKYWFRLVDIKTDRVVWMFSVPEVFEYNKDKPFFHYFSGSTRMFGFCFDDDGESAVFFRKVVERTRRHSIFRPFRSNSWKRERAKDSKSKDKSKTLTAPPPTTTSTSTSTTTTSTSTSASATLPTTTTTSRPATTAVAKTKSIISSSAGGIGIGIGGITTKGSSVKKTSMISSPTPHSFVHVSHVGVNTRGIIESSKNIEPAWGALIADLQGYGITTSASPLPPSTTTTAAAATEMPVVGGGGGGGGIGDKMDMDFLRELVSAGVVSSTATTNVKGAGSPALSYASSPSSVPSSVPTPTPTPAPTPMPTPTTKPVSPPLETRRRIRRKIL